MPNRHVPDFPYSTLADASGDDKAETDTKAGSTGALVGRNHRFLYAVFPKFKSIIGDLGPWAGGLYNSLQFCGGFSRCLVAKVADAGKNHRQIKTIGRLDDLLVADRAPRLNDGRGTSFGDFLDAIGERKESVRGGDSSL